MPEPSPTIRIARRSTSGVTAEGGDAFAVTLLRRAGFIPESSIHRFWHRLHYDIGTDRENARATHAYEMLTAAGYPVVIDPSLRLFPQPADDQPAATHAEMISRALRELGEGVGQLDEAAEVSSLLRVLTDTRNGVLLPVRGLVDQSVQWVEGLPSPRAATAASALREAGRAVLAAHVELSIAADALQTLPDGQQRHPDPAAADPRASAARARTTTDHIPPHTVGPETEAAPDVEPPRPRHSR
ncbi:MAG: hypothetical protein QOF84_5171 [Streptomyces sp.]|jgi:hypothetical protein|nr:hypothetical protein [Streptomyces sp.]